MNKIIALFFVLFFAFGASMASAADTDLKAFMATWKNYLDRSNGGWKIMAGGNVCTSMKSVGLGCSLNDRVALIDYLAQHGKKLFPCETNTNPYFNNNLPITDMGHCSHPHNKKYHNYFIGQPIQNEMLAKAIQKNKHLFSSGNLTLEAAKKWQM